MARAARVLCDRCESKITDGISFCGHCGYPSRWASHEERTTWEVSQWKTANRSHAASSPSQSGGISRRWLPGRFGRKTEDKPALALVSKNESPIEPVRPAEPDAIERTPSRAKPVAKPESSRPALKIQPSPRDTEPLRDTPSTVLAMRLLNARVAELDARIRRLEAELAEGRPEAESLSK